MDRLREDESFDVTEGGRVELGCRRRPPCAGPGRHGRRGGGCLSGEDDGMYCAERDKDGEVKGAGTVATVVLVFNTTRPRRVPASAGAPEATDPLRGRAAGIGDGPHG